MILKDDFDLFKKIEKSSLKDHELGPGKYWKLKNKVIKKSILKYGIKDFRGQLITLAPLMLIIFILMLEPFSFISSEYIEVALSIPPLNLFLINK